MGCEMSAHIDVRGLRAVRHIIVGRKLKSRSTELAVIHHHKITI